MRTVSDLIIKAGTGSRVMSYNKGNLHYIFVVSKNYRRAYKVSNTTNKGYVITSFPMSWARVKKVWKDCVSVYDNGNVVRLRGERGPKTIAISKEV